MKHLILLCSLLAFGLSTPSYAQETDASLESMVNVEELSEGGISLKLNVDSDDSDQQKIKKVTEFVKQLDSEFGKELEGELSQLDEDEQRELVSKFDQSLTINPDIDNFPIGIVFIAVPAVLLIFGTPLFLLIALLVAGHRKRRQKMELVNLYIKNDRDIPEHVMTGLDNGGSASSLKSGLTLTAVGIGIVAALNIAGGEDGAGFGLIPMFLGIARLIFWFLVERKTEDSSNDNSQ